MTLAQATAKARRLLGPTAYWREEWDAGGKRVVVLHTFPDAHSLGVYWGLGRTYEIALVRARKTKREMERWNRARRNP